MCRPPPLPNPPLRPVQAPITHTLPDGQVITMRPKEEGEALLAATLNPSLLGLQLPILGEVVVTAAASHGERDVRKVGGGWRVGSALLITPRRLAYLQIAPLKPTRISPVLLPFADAAGEYLCVWRRLRHPRAVTTAAGRCSVGGAATAAAGALWRARVHASSHSQGGGMDGGRCAGQGELTHQH